MKLLYRYDRTADASGETDADVKVFTPSLRKGLLLQGERGGLRTKLVRWSFQRMTKGRARIFYVTDADGNAVHTSYAVPKCRKFDFMGESDYEIGPCFTHPDHRGKGIYPRVLRAILSSLGAEGVTFWMIVDSENTASIKGIERAGFTRCGTVTKTRTKRYVRNQTES